MENFTKLEQEITRHNSLYREGKPEISDKEYDEMLIELMQVYPDSELLRKGVIEGQPETRKQKLPLPMYSLNKIKSVDELLAWAKSRAKDGEKCHAVITPKLDGISLLVNEKTGQCWTRGDGEYGQVSDKHFGRMSTPVGCDDFYTWGEVIMPKEIFYSKYKDNFANPRNMVAGLFNQKEPSASLHDVHYIRYGVSGYTGLDSRVDELNFLNKLNVDGIPFVDIILEDIDENLLDKLYKDWGLKYQVDGLVIEFSGYIVRDLLGREKNMNPAYAVAYKNPKWSGSVDVTVGGITWNVSKQGKLKPVINIDPTELAGVTISNVTGYNAKYIFDNNIACSSVIKIIRSGDVIPKHIETVDYCQCELELLADEMTKCPCCGFPVKWDSTLTELVCDNPDCYEKHISKLVYFFSSVGIENFGEPSIRQLVNNGFDTIKKILGMVPGDFDNLTGWGEKSVNNLLGQFKGLREVGLPLANIMSACDVFDGKIGSKLAQKIIDSVHSKEYYSSNDLTKIDGVDLITANCYINGMFKFLEMNDLPIKISYSQAPKKEATSSLMSGHKVCFTGFRDKQVEEKIVANGGEVVGGVSGTTTILVVKDLSKMGSTKCEKADKLGVRIFTLDGLLKVYPCLE